MGQGPRAKTRRRKSDSARRCKAPRRGWAKSRRNNFTPEKAFEHRWAITLLEEVYQRLAEEYRAQDKAVLFDALRVTLAGKSEAAPYAELARQLDMSEGAVKVAVHRLRQRYRALLRENHRRHRVESGRSGG